MDMITTFVDFGYFIFGLYSFILILTGTPLNLLCFYVFKRIIPNRSNATIIVFSYLSLVELLIPFTWNLNYAVRELLWKRRKTMVFKNLEQHSLFVCKLVSYSAYFLLQSAAWLKTLATFARCISLHHEWTFRKNILKSTVIHRLCWLTIFLIGLINLPIWIINGKRVVIIDKNNNTQLQIKCYQSIFFQFWEIVHLLLYNFIPFILMILCNISIIRHVDKSRSRIEQSIMRSQSIVKQQLTTSFLTRRSISSSGSRLTKTLLSVTILFIIFTSPSAIFYISLGKIIKRHRQLITMGLSNLATTSHVLSFIIYWLTSTDFQEAVITLFCCRSFISPRPVNDETLLQKRISSPPTLSTVPISNNEIKRKLPSYQSTQSFQ